MRDAHVRRYARHILLPDVGGRGQAALMAAAATLELAADEPLAELICARYLAAGGVGQIVLRGATESQLATVAQHTDDGKLAAAGVGVPVDVPPPPAWWPGAALGQRGETALAFWRGGLAATRWMAGIGNP
jgi:hypothetical protein